MKKHGVRDTGTGDPAGKITKAHNAIMERNPTADDIKATFKPAEYRIIYGIYLAICQNVPLERCIKWSSFYKQLSGARTLKPLVAEALKQFLLYKENNNRSVTKGGLPDRMP